LKIIQINCITLQQTNKKKERKMIKTKNVGF
jgi:hypothetical protein